MTSCAPARPSNRVSPICCSLAAARRTAIMCSEGDHRKCHRHKLITPALLDRGIHVLHIQPDGALVDENEEPRQLTLF